MARKRANPEPYKAAADRHREKNRASLNAYQVAYRAKNAEMVAEKDRVRFEKNKVRYAANRREAMRRNPEIERAHNRKSYVKHAEKRKEWWQKYSSDPEKMHILRAKTAKRRAQQLSARPLWFSEIDDFAMKEAYHLARLRRQVTGFLWHVDHVIPLQGKNVCGLHVHNNIAVIPATANLNKKNRFLIEFGH